MHPTKRAARIAGLLYLLMGLPAPFYLIYLPRKLFVAGDAAATAANVLAHEALFRAGIAGELYNGIVFLLVAVALYRLLVDVNRAQAMLMLIFVVVSAAIGLVLALNNVAALAFFRGGDTLAAFDRRQLDALGAFFLRLHGQGILIDQILWGVWLFPLGLLVIRSGFIPRLIGVWLIVNCFAYVAMSIAGLFLPAYAKSVSAILFPALFGELAIILWLLIKGVKTQPPAAALR